MIRLKKVREEDRELLWNINQKYLYEMTRYYPDEMDGAGNYHYGYFERYFTDSRRIAYLILCDEALAGFAMICPYSYFERETDHVMAEFTIFPAYRRKHAALEAARLILSKHPGRWEIKYNEKNLAGKQLWNKVAAPYRPERIPFGDGETVLAFVRPRALSETAAGGSAPG